MELHRPLPDTLVLAVHTLTHQWGPKQLQAERDRHEAEDCLLGIRHLRA